MASKFRLLGSSGTTFLESALVSSPGSLSSLRITGVGGSPELCHFDRYGNHHLYPGSSNKTRLHLKGGNRTLRIAAETTGNSIQSGVTWTSGSTTDLIISDLTKTNKRMHIDSSGHVGFRTTPAFPFHLVGTNTTDDIMHVYGGGDSLVINFGGTSGGYRPVYKVYQGRGTYDSPLASQNGDILFQLTARGWTGAYSDAARIEMFVDGTPSGTSVPAGFKFYTTPSGSVSALSERMRLSHDGKWGIGQTNPRNRMHIGASKGFCLDNAGTREFIGFNIYNDGSYRHIDTGYASLISFDYSAGIFRITPCPSGTAGAATTGQATFLATNDNNVGIGDQITMGVPSCALDIVNQNPSVGTVAKMFRIKTDDNNSFNIYEHYVSGSDVNYRLGYTVGGTDYDGLIIKDGKVGIRAIPETWLHVWAASHNSELMRWQLSDVSGHHLRVFDNTASGNVIYTFSPYHLTAYANGLKLDSFGNVGIGLPYNDTSAPIRTLHLENGKLHIHSGDYRNEGLEFTVFGADNQGGGRIFMKEIDSEYYGFSILYNGENDNSILNCRGNTFYIIRHPGTLNGSPMLSIRRETGFVGVRIPTTRDPATQLHVRGSSHLMTFIGTAGAGIAYYPLGWSSGRKAFIGNLTGTDNHFYIKSDSGQDIHFRTTGSIYLSSSGFNTTGFTWPLTVNGSMQTLNIAYGAVSNYSPVIPGGTYTGEYSVSFGKTLTSTPIVVATMDNNQVDSYVVIQIMSYSTTGFVYRLFNPHTSSLTLTTSLLRYFAISS